MPLTSGLPLRLLFIGTPQLPFLKAIGVPF
jgi:hypothetical protein